jgi:hypothetical protein
MIMDANTYEYYFDGRKPSLAQVKTLVIKALKQGYGRIEIAWGENMLEIERHTNGQLYGHGWIKGIGGQDMADELQAKGL